MRKKYAMEQIFKVNNVLVNLGWKKNLEKKTFRRKKYFRWKNILR